MRVIDCHTIAMLVVACRSTASAVEQEAPVRRGSQGEPTVPLPWALNKTRCVRCSGLFRFVALNNTTPSSGNYC
jgi:hypothetical protein